MEAHLHHRNDTEDGLRRKLVEFRDRLSGRHGLLGRDGQGRTRFGFIHGNWALCNSRPDGDWCGVNGELGVLRSAGCYADFTFPSAPSPTQPRMVNAIYRAMDAPGRPRGCDRGREVTQYGSVNYGAAPRDPAVCGASLALATPSAWSREREIGGRSALSPAHLPLLPGKPAGGASHSDTPILPYSDTSSLMLITGPLALDWRRRKAGILPRLENGAITAAHPPTIWRARLWARQHIHVEGRPDWVFVKVYTHGGVEENTELLLGAGMRGLHEILSSQFTDGQGWALHYVTAREMYNIVRAAEDGKKGNPGDYRDYEVFRREA